MSVSRIHVAVVDDDSGFLRAIGRLLRAAGFDAVPYPSAEAFLADRSQERRDCAVFDVHLGGMSGLDLRRRLAAEGDGLPVIFVTAHDEPAIREEAQKLGCSAYLRKPVPGKALIEAIHRAVDAAAS